MYLTIALYLCDRRVWKGLLEIVLHFYTKSIRMYAVKNDCGVVVVFYHIEGVQDEKT